MSISAHMLNQCAQGRLGIAHNADVHWIDFPDLLRIGINLYQSRGRYGKREFRIPGTAVGFREAGSDSEDYVGFVRRGVGNTRPPNPGHSERQRMRFRESTFAHERS